MVPVQVGNRIAYSVDPSRAAVMARGINVRVIRSRKTSSIVRLIIAPRELGDGCSDEPSSHQSSLKSTKIEYLFCKGESASKGIAGSRLITVHKPSYLFRPIPSLSSSGYRREGKRNGEPTTTANNPPVPDGRRK